MKEIALYTLDIAQNSITAQAKRLDITLTEEGETITLSIRDDGTGMAPELLARVSDPFTTTRTTRAMGLGLPLLRLAAEQTGHGEHPQTIGVGLEHGDQRGSAGFFPDDLQIVYDLLFFDHKPFHLLSPSQRATCFPVFLPVFLSLWPFPGACPFWFSAHRRRGAECAPFSFRRPQPD